MNHRLRSALRALLSTICVVALLSSSVADAEAQRRRKPKISSSGAKAPAKKDKKDDKKAEETPNKDEGAAVAAKDDKKADKKADKKEEEKKKPQDDPNYKATQKTLAQVTKLISDYKDRNFIVPKSLNELTQGPLPVTSSVPSDAWGNSFVYTTQGDQNYKIFSLGADGKAGTEDDVKPQ
jgi:hypothetical protein